MSRQRDPRIKRRLREGAIDYVLESGFTDFSLRPAAAALGTSARMLAYHFGSREGLLRDILAGLREREAARIEAWWSNARSPRTMAGFVRWYWKRLAGRAAEPAVRLIFELYALALRHPEELPGVLTEPVAYWQALVRRAGLRSDVATSTLLLAATRGLLLDLTATGDRARVDKAVARLCALLEK